jgi:hypothetical protein
MTGLSYRKNRQEDLTGPKIRHPSGTIYPTIIFMKEKNNLNQLSNAAKLYQNILEFPLSKHNPHTFKITEMGYWLLEQNEDYRDYYTGSKSHIRMSIRLDCILKRAKKYLGNLLSWSLIEQVTEVDSDTRNGQKTFLYRFTDMGYIIAWAIEYYNFCNGFLKLGRWENLDTMKEIKLEIFELTKKIFTKFHSYMTDFLVEFYTKCMEFDRINNCPFDTANGQIGLGLFDQIILTLVHLLIEGKRHFPNSIEYLSAAHTFILMNKITGCAALKAYLMALDELPDRTRTLIIAHEKAEIESRFVISQPSKDWADVWLENITNHEILVLYSICQNKDCKAKYAPALMPYRLYREKLVTASKTINYDDGFPPMLYMIGNCQACKTKDSTYIFDTYENVRRCINQS